jgi:hypothetical protein
MDGLGQDESCSRCVHGTSIYRLVQIRSQSHEFNCHFFIILVIAFTCPASFHGILIVMSAIKAIVTPGKTTMTAMQPTGETRDTRGREIGNSFSCS